VCINHIVFIVLVKINSRNWNNNGNKTLICIKQSEQKWKSTRHKIWRLDICFTVRRKCRLVHSCVTYNVPVVISLAFSEKLTPAAWCRITEPTKKNGRLVRERNLQWSFPGRSDYYIRERQRCVNANSTGVCMRNTRVGYDLITRSAINPRWIIVTIFSIRAGRRHEQWVYRPFLSHDLRPNVLCIPFTGKGCVWLAQRIIPGSAASW